MFIPNELIPVTREMQGVIHHAWEPTTFWNREGSNSDRDMWNANEDQVPLQYYLPESMQ